MSMYSREIRTLDCTDPSAAVKKLLAQLNAVQEETEREAARLKARIAELEARVTALEES
jgi:cell division protein FtsB